MSTVDAEPVAAAACHLCGGPLAEFTSFREFRRITSDCRPWPAGGRLCGCTRCGSVQKIVDDTWRREIDELYAGYAIYDQAAGAEQPVFDQATGAAASRSSRILAALGQAYPLPPRGRLLDIGCGNGAMLRAFSQTRPGWSLAGTELDGKYRRQIERIAGVESLYTCPPWETPGEFDCATMIHVLEHIPEPEGYLARLRTKLRPGGMLVVELPHHVANPFELLIADHCTHFAADTAADLLRRTGFEVLEAVDDWVPKELTLVARPGAMGTLQPQTNQPTAAARWDVIAARIAWLEKMRDATCSLAPGRTTGIFGTSIAGTWLFAELRGAAEFFVDEDPLRVGKTWQGRPVYWPSAVPAGARVIMPLPRGIAECIARRIARPDVEIILPPE